MTWLILGGVVYLVGTVLFTACATRCSENLTDAPENGGETTATEKFLERSMFRLCGRSVYGSFLFGMERRECGSLQHVRSLKELSSLRNIRLDIGKQDERTITYPKRVGKRTSRRG